MNKIKNNIVKVLRDPDSKKSPRKSPFQHQQQLDLHQTSIYLEHRQFLNQYKSNDSQNLSRTKENQLQKSKISHHSLEKQNVVDQQTQQKEHKVNISLIEERMSIIHKRIEKDMTKLQPSEEKDRFKIFTNIITNKKDIERIGKERRFTKSIDNKKFPYEEPKMSNIRNLPIEQRNLHLFFDEKKLVQEAKEFTQKVQKEKEKLWGIHLLNKKREEERRQISQIKERERIKRKRQLRILEKYKIPKESTMFAQSRVLQRSKTEQTHPIHQAIQFKRFEESFRNIESENNEFFEPSLIDDPNMARKSSEPLEKMTFENENVQSVHFDKIKIDFNIKKPRRYTAASRNMEETSNLNRIVVNLDPIKREQSSGYGSNSSKKTEKKKNQQKIHKNSMETDLSSPQKNFPLKKQVKQTSSESNY